MALVMVAEQCVGELKPQELANMAWACATAGQWGEALFVALARVAEQRAGDFKPQAQLAFLQYAQKLLVVIYVYIYICAFLNFEP